MLPTWAQGQAVGWAVSLGGGGAGSGGGWGGGK
jgi:hypothetical protein